MSNNPSPVGNPTLEGFDILATTPAVEGALQRTVRALVVRYTDSPEVAEYPCDSPFVIWQERRRGSDEWRYRPGSNTENCEAVIVALMGIK